MNASIKLLALAAVTALAAAAPAVAGTKVATPNVGVKASGTVRTLDMNGGVTGFRLMYGITKTPKLVYVDQEGRVIFRSVTIHAVASSLKAVRFAGTGVTRSGRKAPFAAIVVQGAQTGGQDRFGLSWGHGAQFGGHLLSGAIRIQIPLIGGSSRTPKAY